MVHGFPGRFVVKTVENMRRSMLPAKTGTVYLDERMAWFGILEILIVVGITIYTYFSKAPAWAYIVCSALALPGVCLIVAFINCRIFYDDEGFIAKNFFGMQRAVTYDQVVAVERYQHETYLYFDEYRILVDEFAIGGKEFIRLVEKRYYAIYKKTLPVK